MRPNRRAGKVKLVDIGLIARDIRPHQAGWRSEDMAQLAAALGAKHHLIDNEAQLSGELGEEQRLQLAVHAAAAAGG